MRAAAIALLLAGPVALSTSVQTPAADVETLAFRLDDHRVIVLLAYDSNRRVDPSAREVDTAAKIPGSIAILPEDRPLPPPYDVKDRPGDRWIVRSHGRQHEMTLDRFAMTDGRECGEGSTAMAVLSTSDAAFARDREKYFVAFRTGAAPPPMGRDPSLNLALTAGERLQLIDAVTAESKNRIPALLRGDARIDVRDVQAFRLSPDGQPRLFVRSRIVKAHSSQPGLMLWLKQDKNPFVVESADDWFATFIAGRSSESRGTSREPADHSFILNVVPAADGWAYVIFGRRGYESIAVTIYRYSERGFVPAGIAFKHGC